MGRPVMLSNGQLMVGLNELGLVNDFYYPYVGLDNLTNARSMNHRIGVWVNNKFSWVDNREWDIKVDFDNDALMSIVSLTSAKLGIRLEFSDFIDCDYNVFARRINVTNNQSAPSDIRLFMHQVFQISRAGRADTALFVPDANYILDYKGRCALLIYGQTDDGQPFDQYAVGNYNIEGKEGTYKDAEDGELSGNAVEHGGVDSVIRFKLNLNPNETKQINYWIIAAASQYECETVHEEYIKDGIDVREQVVKSFWHKWLNIGADVLHLVDKKYLNSVKKSLMVIKAHTDRRGGILASGDSSIFNYGRDYYCYCWPRDGAYALWPLIRLGYIEEAKNFFEFCRDTMDKKGYMMHKYLPDRSIGSTWHPLIHENRRELAIQEDETAIIICMLAEFYELRQEKEFVQSLYLSMIKPMSDFMSGFIDEQTNLPHASYDLWEEKFLTNSYTVFLVMYALEKAARFADEFEFPDDAVKWRDIAQKIKDSTELLYDPDRKIYRKGFYLKPDGSLKFDNTLDASSLYGAFLYGDKKLWREQIISTAQALENTLTGQGSVGGVIRYEQDWYMRIGADQPPNPWFVCTFWLAQYYIEIKQLEKAEKIMDWSLKHAMPSGILSEQIDPRDGLPVGVAPLVWSHAELINTVLDISDEKEKNLADPGSKIEIK